MRLGLPARDRFLESKQKEDRDNTTNWQDPEHTLNIIEDSQ
jgi:hypothetical protein